MDAKSDDRPLGFGAGEERVSAVTPQRLLDLDLGPIRRHVRVRRVAHHAFPILPEIELISRMRSSAAWLATMASRTSPSTMLRVQLSIIGARGRLRTKLLR